MSEVKITFNVTTALLLTFGFGLATGLAINSRGRDYYISDTDSEDSEDADIDSVTRKPFMEYDRGQIKVNLWRRR